MNRLKIKGAKTMTGAEAKQPPQIKPEALHELQPNDVQDFRDLMSQPVGEPVDTEQLTADLQQAISAPDSEVFVVRDGEGRIQSTATATICRIPTGVKPWVEDVLSDSDLPDDDLTRLSMQATEEWFLAQGVTTANVIAGDSEDVMDDLLTSNGYNKRETRLYRLDLLEDQEEIDTSSVEILEELSESDVDDFMRLLPQLTNAPAPELEKLTGDLRQAIDSPYTKILVIRDENGRIQASATTNICPKPDGTTSWIDDVVTDESARGKGYGKTIMGAAHKTLQSQGSTAVYLTSAPFRDTAGNLYTRMGYEELQDKVYRKQLEAAA